ncbi:unnamed protein product [Sphagnum jensenii]|uniref:Uncharacterized protein n=1 Tax=Sphagnum jensenii TaxID=128206 RepID=A0ABP0VQT9_9BRYO
MARYNGPAAMEIRQHVGTTTLPPCSSSSPSASVDLTSLNPSFSSNITTEFASSFFDTGSQNSFGHSVGSATLIPLSQSQTMPPKGMQNGVLLPADEWSGTTNNARPGVPGGQQQQQQGFQSSQDQVASSHTTFQSSKQQFVYETGRLPASSQVGQEAIMGRMGSNRYQRLLSGQQTAALQGRAQQLQSFQSGAPRGVTVSQHLAMQKPKEEQQATEGSVVGKLQMSAVKAEKSEYTALEGLKAEYMIQDSLTQAAPMRMLQDTECQEPSFPGAITTTQQSVFDEAATSSQLSVLNSDLKSSNLGPLEGHSGGMGQAAGFQGEDFGNPQSSYLSTFEQGQRVSNHLHTDFQGTQQLQPNPYSGQQGTASQLQNQGMQMPTANSPTNLQSPLMAGQQSGFSGQMGANHLAHFQAHSTSQQSLLQMQSPSQMSSYQVAQAQAQAQVQAAQAQAQAQALSQVHAQAQATNQHVALQQAVANQAARIQAQQAQQAGVGSQQLMYHTGQQQSYQPGQAQAFQMANGLQLTGAAQQMLAQMQPRLQNQLLQGLKLGGRQLLHAPGSGTGDMSGGTADDVFRTPMSTMLASKCNHVIMRYIQQQRNHLDNSISFWMNLVHDFFEPGALKRWCLSSYSTSPVGRHAQGLFPMEFWFCNLCGVQPGRGFESSTDVLPRLFKIKYDSGLQDELLFLDLPQEKYVLPSGRMVLEYADAVHESVFRDLRVVRYGRLRVTFSPSFKIQAWEFCTKNHEEVVPCRNLLEQAQQLTRLVMEAEQEDFDKSMDNLTKHCNAFTSTARQLAVKLDAPMVNDLGFSKRYVRCLQISEVVNSMKDLISFERKTGLGPIVSLARFPSARNLQQEGLLLNSPTQPSLTQMINHLTQGSSHPSQVSYVHQPGQLPRIHPHLQGLAATGQQAAPQVQGHHLNQLQPAGVLQGQQEPSMANFAQLSNQLQSQLQGEVEARNYGFVQGGQAFNNQVMQPPASPHLAGSLPSAHASNTSLTQPHLQQLSAQALSQLQGRTSPGLLSGSPSPLSGNQIQMQQNHMQMQSQLQGQAGLSQISPPVHGGGQPSPNFNQLSQQGFQTTMPQSPAQVQLQTRTLNQAGNRSHQSLPGTPQSEMSDLRSNT